MFVFVVCCFVVYARLDPVVVDGDGRGQIVHLMFG